MGNVKLAIRNRENANFILSIRLVLGVFANICLYILCVCRHMHTKVYKHTHKHTHVYTYTFLNGYLNASYLEIPLFLFSRKFRMACQDLEVPLMINITDGLCYRFLFL